MSESLKTKEQTNKSFDVLASVNLMRHDLESYGNVLPETLDRVYDEELTFVAEGIDRPLYTAFQIRSIEGQMSYWHEGQWRPYMTTLVSGLQAAEAEALADSKKFFLAERAAEDLKIGYDLETMLPGDSIAWHSPFPEKELELYGEKFLSEQGFQPKRKMGFIYRAEKREDGNVILESQTVDNSDPAAFECAMDASPNAADMKTLLSAYDKYLEDKYGEVFSAGRRVGDKVEEDAWQFLTHQDQRILVEHYFSEIEAMSKSQKPLSQLEMDKQHLTYGFWAALKLRLDNFQVPASENQTMSNFSLATCAPGQEIRLGAAWAAERGEIMAGCGGSISRQDSAEQMRDSIFGATARDRYGSLKFDCPTCGHENTRPHGQLIDCCQSCKSDVTC